VTVKHENRADDTREAANQRPTLVVDWSLRDTIVVTGPDRVTWLNAIVTCDVARVGPSNGVWGLLLTKQGKIVTDLTVVAGEGRLYVSVQPSQGAAVLEFLDRMLIMEDAELEDASARYSWLTLHGPAAVAEASRVAAATGSSVAAVDWTGLGGAALVVSREHLDAVRRELTASSAVSEADEADWLALRLERGLPEMGIDFGPDDNPHQASLDHRAVAWDKGCYLGQEVVCMVDMRGKVRRRLVPIVLDGAVSPARSAAVMVAGRDEPVGTVTSGVLSRRLGRGIALARVLTTHSEPGTSVSVDGVAGRVTELPDA